MTEIIGVPAGSSETDVRLLIARMTDASTDPQLSSEDLDDLIGVAARADEDGLYRGDDGWTETWDVNAAAAEGWRRKAARAVAKFDFAEDSQRFSRAQIFQHCKEQERSYADKGMGFLT